MERISRIRMMEAAFMRAQKALADGRYDAGEFTVLADYMESGAWLSDYEADEKGQVDQALARGVLSQDALYELLTEWENAKRGRSR